MGPSKASRWACHKMSALGGRERTCPGRSTRLGVVGGPRSQPPALPHRLGWRAPPARTRRSSSRPGPAPTTPLPACPAPRPPGARGVTGPPAAAGVERGVRRAALQHPPHPRRGSPRPRSLPCLPAQAAVGPDLVINGFYCPRTEIVYVLGATLPKLQSASFHQSPRERGEGRQETGERQRDHVREAGRGHFFPCPLSGVRVW